MVWKWERRWWVCRRPDWSVMIDFGVSAEPYWRELQTKGPADRLRSFSLVAMCWDRMEFDRWGVAQGPAVTLVFLKLRFWFVK